MALYKNIISFSFFILISYYLKAQEAVPSYLGTKTPYYSLQKKHTSPPAGFTPVFVNYVGRHGARFMTKRGSDVLITDVLQQAAKQNALTAIGKQALQTALQFDSAEKNNYENITQLGADEQREIGGRMYKEYSMASAKKEVDVLMTTKVRTQQSADAFLTGFPARPANNIHRSVLQDSADAMLRFYDMSPAYDNYKNSSRIQQHLDSLQTDKRMNTTANRITGKLFTAAFIQQLMNRKISADNGSGKGKTITAVAFVQALYDIYSIWFSAVKEIKKTCGCIPKNHLQNVFTKDDLQWLDAVNNAEDFYVKGPAENAMGIQVTIAAPLLVNFINTTDSVINGTKNAKAVFRFTHAEAISPFATLLGIPQASSESRSVYTFQQGWQASQIIPLSANIQWILYRKNDQYVVKVLLNEKEVKLPVESSIFPYYNWQAVKQYYIGKLSKLGITLQSDMKAYLSGADTETNK